MDQKDEAIQSQQTEADEVVSEGSLADDHEDETAGRECSPEELDQVVGGNTLRIESTNRKRPA